MLKILLFFRNLIAQSLYKGDHCPWISLYKEYQWDVYLRNDYVYKLLNITSIGTSTGFGSLFIKRAIFLERWKSIPWICFKFCIHKVIKLNNLNPKFQPPVTISSQVTAAESFDLEAIF